MTRLSVGHRVVIKDTFGELHEGVIQGWETGGFWILSNGNGAPLRLQSHSIAWIRGPLKA